ncbi:MAG: 4Fe-4S dicluster domain-containing protein [bacterium]
MIFKTIAKKDFRSLVESLLLSTEVIAPRRMGTNNRGKPIHQYLPVKTWGEIDLDYETTEYSAKTYLLPYQENLSTYRFNDADWSQEIRYRLVSRVLLGLHACDINGILKLDKVLARDNFPSPYYISRRKNTLLIGIDHMPCEGAFCQSLGTDTVTHGYDLFLTDLDDRYFVNISSDRGYELILPHHPAEVTDQDTRDYNAVRRKILNAYETRIEVQNLPTLLDIEFESPVWKKWGDKCLSCGSCAMVCPTCYCYGVSERVSMNFEEGAKVKKLHSCNLLDFAVVAGGHNFRPTKQTRLKYRYYHQHRGFMESYEEMKCVGCNRCGRVCLAGINPVSVIRDLQMEERL